APRRRTCAIRALTSTTSMLYLIQQLRGRGVTGVSGAVVGVEGASPGSGSRGVHCDVVWLGRSAASPGVPATDGSGAGECGPPFRRFHWGVPLAVASRRR